MAESGLQIATLDWVIALVLLASIGIGLWRGFIYELLALANWVQAIVLARWLGEPVMAWLGASDWALQWQRALGFALVFVLALLLGGWLASLIRRWVARSGLRPADRALGALFGGLRAALVLVVAAMVVHGMGLQGSAWWVSSVGARQLDTGVAWVRSGWAPQASAKER